jgi:hypothetical protein
MSNYKYYQIERVGDGPAVRILLDRPDARNAQSRGIACCGYEAAPTSGVRSIWAGLPRLLLASAERHDKAVSLSAFCNRRTVRLGPAQISGRGRRQTVALCWSIRRKKGADRGPDRHRRRDRRI